MADDFRILFVADVVGRPGRAAVAALLPALKRELQAHLTIVNGENSAGGFGLTAKTVRELLAAGADLITTGNHVFDQREFVTEIIAQEKVLRPHNYPPGAPGRGYCVIDVDGEPVLVINLQGRLFLNAIDDPFRAADAILALEPVPKIVFCDMHGEATSESLAMGWYLDGRASAVVGTHRHVQTADERVLPGGTAYITDLGMTGPTDGVIGVDRDIILQRFLTQMPVRFEPAKGPAALHAAIIVVDPETGRASDIRRLRVPA